MPKPDFLHHVLRIRTCGIAYLVFRLRWVLVRVSRMNSNDQFCTKLIHCGNNSIANPEDQIEKNIFFMPMGLFALASALRKNGINTEIINSDAEKNKSIQEILDFDSLDAVGFDCHWVNQSLAVLDTAELIKRIKPRVFIFLGGFTASLFAEEIMSTYPQIDAIIRGDAEIPIVKLCVALYDEKLRNKGVTSTKGIQSLSNVPNLVWRGSNNEIEVNDFSYVATQEELDKLDFASLDLLRNWEYYRKRSIYWTRFAPFNFAPFNFAPLFLLEVGRGCQYGCIFCGGNCEAQRRINNRKKIVCRSVDSVIATIKKAMSFGFRTFFSDFEFEGSDDWYIGLFNRIKKERLNIHYVYSCWSLTSKALIDALSEGFERVFVQISPETSNMDLRKKNKGLHTPYTNDELEECLSYIDTKNNIKVQLYFGYFLAFERGETVLNTIEYIVQLLLKFPNLLEIAYMPFSTDPGSLLFFYPEKYDIDIEVRNFRDYIKCIKETYVVKKLPCPDMRLFKPKGISNRDAIELERKIELFNYLFISYRQSVSYILQKTGNPNVIMKFLRETDVPVTSDSSEIIKDMLLSTCNENDIGDVHLVETMNVECEIQKKSKQQVFRAKPQIWLYCKSEESNQ